MAGARTPFAPRVGPRLVLTDHLLARHRRMKRRASVGLALAGGGPLGGIYEVGALIALSDSLDGIDLNDVDVYVGVSSGGFVSAALANGISPTQMYRLFIDDGVDATLSPGFFLRPALGEFARRGLSLPRLFVGAALARIRKADRRNIVESIVALSADLSRAIPTGLFDQRGAPISFRPRVAAMTFASSATDCS